ncbi:MAG TPA: nucleotidyltransferase [Polyangia bacterium]|nr:nucleotidyltransferase [Polyangia bacterium]
MIGGLAAQAHGSARITQDTDFLYRRTPENIERLTRALAPFQPYLRGAPPGLPFRFDAATVRRGLNFTLTTTLGDIDVLGEVTGVGGYEAVWPHARSLPVFGHDALVIDLPWLIRSKRAAGRPKDLEAIAELEALLAERENGV